jgi:4-hydroxythreonine-4-phosphate dehydrogenase
MGDPAGIGPEIIVKAFMQAPGLTRNCLIAGDVACIRRAAASLATDQPQWPVVVVESTSQLLHVPPRCLPVIQVTDELPAPDMGKVSAEAGRMAAQSVIWAAQAALRGDVLAIVTAPLNKEALSASKLPDAMYPGHTEMLQAQSARHLGRPMSEVPVRMMLANDELRTVLVSIHLSLREAIEAVTFDAVLETLRITDQALRRSLGRAPRMAVAGLNPHAGEGGLFGREELDIIAPAIRAAQSEGLNASGPYPPDTIFMRARQALGEASEFDVVVAMYHDQGLIPVKYMGVEQGVNVTLGLPLVRTSPDHGTAFDIAGKGVADPSSLLAAIQMAKAIAAGPSIS